MDISRLDLSLLVTLDVLLAERNVTRAARRLNLSQPALSARLNRLRDVFADPLLLPAQRGMAPTLRALELQGPLREALEGLRQVISSSTALDPSTVVATVAISASDYVQCAVLLPLMRKLRSAAPGLRLAWRNLDVPALPAQLERGEVDLALLTPASAPPIARVTPLYEERYVLIARKGHPQVRGHIDTAIYCDLDHIVVSPDGGGFRGPTDLILEAAGRARRTVLSAPAFLVALEMVVKSDMIAVVPERLAREQAGRLLILPPPVDVPGFDIAMAWHDRTTTHPIHKWLREQIVRFAKSPASGDGQVVS